MANYKKLPIAGTDGYFISTNCILTKVEDGKHTIISKEPNNRVVLSIHGEDRRISLKKLHATTFIVTSWFKRKFKVLSEPYSDLVVDHNGDIFHNHNLIDYLTVDARGMVGYYDEYGKRKRLSVDLIYLYHRTYSRYKLEEMSNFYLYDTVADTTKTTVITDGFLDETSLADTVMINKRAGKSVIVLFNGDEVDRRYGIVYDNDIDQPVLIELLTGDILEYKVNHDGEVIYKYQNFNYGNGVKWLTQDDFLDS